MIRSSRRQFIRFSSNSNNKHGAAFASHWAVSQSNGLSYSFFSLSQMCMSLFSLVFLPVLSGKIFVEDAALEVAGLVCAILRGLC